MRTDRLIASKVFAYMADTLSSPVLQIDTTTKYGRIKALAVTVTKEKLLEARKDGLSYEEMAVMYNCTTFQVYELLKYWGIVGNIKQLKRKKALKGVTKCKLDA